MAYIEREKAIDEIDKWLDSVGYVTVGKGLTSYGELIGCLEDTPTADVAEVVRCKDCKNAYINSFSAQSGIALCKLLTNRANGEQMLMRQDDFCSYGERKDGK